MTERAATRYLTSWRTISFGTREIIEGIVAREHDAPSPELRAALAAWDGYYYWEHSPDGQSLILVRELRAPHERWWLHALLLALALLTITLGGSIIAGASATWYQPGLAQLGAGLPFSLPLAAILLAHESGHYLVARRYRVDASPPYFIPFPPINLIGTLGAFIRLRSPVLDRRTLFDIGAAGPLSGMAIAIPALIAGLLDSHGIRGSGAPLLAHQYVLVFGDPLFVGDSILLRGCERLAGLQGIIQLSPLAMAGWVGILVTALNLLPLAQFDGGHITFALFGRAQRWIAWGFWLALLPLGWWLWRGWWLWAVLALVIGRGRLAHPPLLSPERPLDRRRQFAGYVVLLLFVVTFMPVPLAS